MAVNVRDKIAKLSVEQRKKVEDRAAKIIAEEMSLRELRRARKLTQARVAKTLGISQDGVSRLEKRSDLLLSTLRKTVRAMGGDVRIVAEFPDREPVVLSELSNEDPKRKSSQRRRGSCSAARLPVAAPPIISHNPNPTMSRVARIIILLLWLTLGLALILAPWSDVWETNYFAYQYPGLGLFLKNLYLRGAISGLGFMNILMSLESFRHRSSHPAASRT
jgi:transcriptional regulator with XRE-family HTH domain